MGIVGFKELDRGGFRKVRLNLGVFFIALISIPLIIVPLMSLFTRYRLHWQIAGLDPLYICFFIIFPALWVTIFPLALYLNQKQNKSTPQQESANEA
jgi:hypothetical protein